MERAPDVADMASWSCARHIRTAREGMIRLNGARDWTQTAVARRIAIHWRTYARWESGESMPSRANRRLLERVYGMAARFLDPPADIVVLAVAVPSMVEMTQQFADATVEARYRKSVVIVFKQLDDVVDNVAEWMIGAKQAARCGQYEKAERHIKRAEDAASNQLAPGLAALTERISQRRQDLADGTRPDKGRWRS